MLYIVALFKLQYFSKQLIFYTDSVIYLFIFNPFSDHRFFTFFWFSMFHALCYIFYALLVNLVILMLKSLSAFDY